MTLVRGVLTELGGTTSHAAVVSREIGVPCIVGCGEGSLMHLVGRRVTMDAELGEVLDGELGASAAKQEINPYLAQLATWARTERPLAGDDGDLIELFRARGTKEGENPYGEPNWEKNQSSAEL